MTTPQLIKYSYPDLFAQCEWVLKVIDEIRDIRNDFAHSQTTVLIEDAVKHAQGHPIEGVTLGFWKDGKVEHKVVSSKKALEYINKALALTMFLNRLHSEIETRISTNKTGNFNTGHVINHLNTVYRYASLKKPSKKARKT